MPLPTVYGVSAPPFRLSSSSLEAFAHPSWTRAEHEVLAAVARGERALLLGPPGTGKTLLLQNLERTLRAAGASVRVLRHGEPLAAVPGIDVLFIDEAGGFPDEELERICRRPGAVVLAGLPCLQQRIARWAGPIGIVTLEPLSPADVGRFVVARLGESGRSGDLFTPDAVAALARHSGGLLRLVIILAGAALFFAGLRGAAQVTVGDVDEAAAMRSAVAEEAEPEAPSPEAPKPGAPLLDALQAEPAWLRPVAPSRRGGLWPAAGVAAGLTGVTCAALAIAALAIVAALSVSAARPIPLQAQDGRSSPVLASATPQPLLAAPSVPAPAPVPPPVQLDATPPPAPHPAVHSAPAPAFTPAWAPALVPASAPEPASAQAAVPSPGPALPPVRPPPPEMATRAAIVLAFSGPIMNETMGQGGRLSLELRTDGSEGPVGAWFHASHGLIGTGTLRGRMHPDGRITLSGRLMMGRNPFDCALQATLDGDHLVGEATFVRATSGAKAHSRFTLRRL